MTEAEIYKYKKEQQIETVREQLEILKPFLENDDLTDIMINQNGKVFTDGYLEGMVETNVILDISERKRIADLLAGWNNKILSEDSPFLSGRLPTKERFEIVTGKCTNYQTTITIRKPPKKIFELDEYVKNGDMTLSQKKYLIEAIENKKNILLVGGTGTGKTSKISSLINELIGTKDRIIIVEEVEEIMIKEDENKNPLISNLLRYETTEKINALRILKSLMRQYPDRIIFGELRWGEEVETFLDALNTGHSGGLSSLHANTALDGLHRLVELLTEVNGKTNPRPYMVARGINVVISLKRERDKNTGKTRRFINEIIEVNGYDRIKEEFMYKEVI